jgi:integrase
VNNSSAHPAVTYHGTAQMGKFLDHVSAHRLGGCFAFTLLGLRREEVGGLRWSDVNLETGALRIR